MCKSRHRAVPEKSGVVVLLIVALREFNKKVYKVLRLEGENPENILIHSRQ